MSERLTLVQRAPFSARTIHVASKWRAVALQSYVDTGCAYGTDPELLADRLCLEIIPTDDQHAELIGSTILLPDGGDFYETGLLVYELIARALLVRIGSVPNATSIAAVCAELVLPRSLARGANPARLSEFNHYVPLEYLRSVYMSHRERSGEMPAVG